jgi:hypothetical protein
MTLADEPTTAEMDPWLLVEVHGEDCLFGFAKWHPTTGGLSWTRSTPIIELDETAGRARTASGRVYALGRAIEFEELDEEASLAWCLVAGAVSMPEAARWRGVRWLTARKMARHLGTVAPPRSDPEAVEKFLEAHRERYLSLRRGWDKGRN